MFAFGGLAMTREQKTERLQALRIMLMEFRGGYGLINRAGVIRGGRGIVS